MPYVCISVFVLFYLLNASGSSHLVQALLCSVLLNASGSSHLVQALLCSVLLNASGSSHLVQALLCSVFICLMQVVVSILFCLFSVLCLSPYFMLHFLFHFV